MQFDYVDNCIYVVTTFLIADISWRLLQLTFEWCIFQSRYLPPKKLWQMFKLVFSYNRATHVFIMLWIVICGIRMHFRSHSPHHENHWFPLSFTYLLVGIPMYWLIRIIEPHHSNIDYSLWIRNHHNLDCGEVMASSYFHGYLKLTLPQSTKETPGIKERINRYEAIHKVLFPAYSLMVLVPDSLFTKPIIDSPLLERVAPLEEIRLYRAGIYRPYQNDVYKLKRPINGIYYYLALEGATPLLTFYETMKDSDATWHMKIMQREIYFKFYFNLKKLLKNPETEREVELIMYSGYLTNGRPQDPGEIVYEYINNMYLEGRIRTPSHTA